MSMLILVSELASGSRSDASQSESALALSTEESADIHIDPKVFEVASFSSELELDPDPEENNRRKGAFAAEGASEAP